MTTKRIASTTAMALCLAVLSVPATAQDATVAADALYLGRIIVGYSADGTPIYAGDNTSVIEGDALTGQGGMTKLDEVVRQTPGVTTLFNGGQPGISMAIRGFGGSHVESTIEGVPQNFRFTAHNNADGFTYVDPMMLSSLEISRGATITSGGMAGAVNMRLLSADDLVQGDEGTGGLVRLRYGDNGEGFASVAAYGLRKGPAELAFAVSRTSLDAFVNGAGTEILDTDQDTASVMLRGSYQVSDTLKLSVMALDYQASYGSTQNGFVPGTFVIYDMDVSNRILNFGFEYSDGSDLVNLTGNIYAGTTEHKHVAGNGSAVGRTMATETIGFNLRNVSSFELGDWSVTSTNGFDVARDKLTGKTGGSNPTTGDTRRNALYTENVFSNGPFEVTLGLRFSTYDLDWTNVDGPQSISETAADPKITLAYQVTDSIQPYVSVYRTSRAPTMQEAFLGGTSGLGHGGGFGMYFGNPDLVPETSAGYEVGANIAKENLFAANDRLTGRLAFYDLDVKNFIVVEQQAPMGMKFVNIDETVRSRGMELELGYESDAFSAVLAWAHTDAKYGAGRLQPKDAVSATLAGHFLGGDLTVGTTLTYNSNGIAAIAFDTNTAVESYKTVDLFASYDVSDTFRIDAKIANLTDELYTPWAARDNTGVGRSAYIGAELRF